MGDGDVCGSCDVLVCARCLKGTARCPSCQRAFAETRGAAPSAERRGDATLDRGRQETLAIGASLAVASVLVAVMSEVSTFRTLIVLAMLGLLVTQLFRGRSWARWLLVIGCAAYSLGIVFGQVAITSGSRLVALGLAVVFVVDAFVLTLSASVERYLRAQRLRHP
jgi:hypothetical protein